MPAKFKKLIQEEPLFYKIEFHGYEIILCAVREDDDTMSITLKSKSEREPIDQIRINKLGEVIVVLNRLKRKIKRLEKAKAKQK